MFSWEFSKNSQNSFNKRLPLGDETKEIQMLLRNHIILTKDIGKNKKTLPNDVKCKTSKYEKNYYDNNWFILITETFLEN